MSCLVGKPQPVMQTQPLSMDPPLHLSQPAIPEDKKKRNPTQYNNDLEKSTQECPITKLTVSE
jgi:hypothetical protein